ncbi:hypothetical protein HKK74_00275 [Actinomadura alba]|uniref:Uncharacterized protein n=1 Tax=Actinomadura alba TaxID=406431 RepID=A0ABR7LGH1_9ACTN|nr:hypothetical protein [Actinomadura alba]
MLALTITFVTPGTVPAAAAAAEPPTLLPGSSQAEIFATNNTDVITDPNDPRLDTRLTEFALQVRTIIQANGGVYSGSTLVDGVFWSSSGQYVTYERSRDFDVNDVDELELRHIAELVGKEFDQESVLTFRHLPSSSPAVDAVRVEVPGVDVQRLYEGLMADPVVRDRLGGGSVTLDGRLILVAGVADLSLVRSFVTALGGDWLAATVEYGDWEFVG